MYTEMYRLKTVDLWIPAMFNQHMGVTVWCAHTLGHTVYFFVMEKMHMVNITKDFVTQDCRKLI